MSIIRNIFRFITDEIIGQLRHAFEAYTRRMVRRVIKLLAFAVVGLTFLAVGFLFMLFGIATYLAQFMFSGLAYAIVGLIAVLSGGILLLLIRR